MHWKAHLRAMRPELSRSKNVGGTYYKLWLANLDIGAAVGVDGSNAIEAVRVGVELCKSRVDIIRNAVGPSGATVESTVVLPPGADDARLSGPALYHDHQQGGPARAKLTSGGAAEFTPQQIERACENFAHFWHCPADDVTREIVEEFGSSLGIEGWSSPDLRLLSYRDIEAEKQERERAEAGSGCCTIGIGSGTHVEGELDDADEATREHNRQVIKLIDVLGQTGAGKRAVVRAIAVKQGIDSEDELEKMFAGKSEKKLEVPRALREPLRDIGMGGLLAPLNILTASEPQHILVNEAWKDLEFEVALDSGSVVHVCSQDDCPGYMLAESPGSRRGQEFLMGDGGTIPNMGQSKLNLTDQGSDIESVFQIAAVTRPLMSVGKICDEGHSVTFDAIMAIVRSKDGEELCRFHRKDGGLYVAKLTLKSPAGFGRQE
jgi:hypothetical protein